jgi:predicted phage terminase large subunit-like protein
VGGAVTGHGADFGIVDDPIKPADVLSDAIRTSTNEWLIGTFLSRANDKRISKTLVVQQRLDVNDASAVFLRLDDTNHLNLPAIADRDQRHTLGPRREYLWKQGEPLQTVREDLQVLAKERKKIGERNFQAQYLQQPLPLDGGILKWSWFQFFDERPTMSAGDRHIFSWDTAVTDGGASAYSACTEWIVRGRYYYLVNLIRERLLYPEIKQTMLRQAKEYPRAIILVEDAVSGQSVRQDLRSVGINVIGIKPEGSKEQRAALASDQIEAGNVFLPRHASWSAEFQAECLAFPSGKYKDQVDSMSQAILWVEKKRHNSGTTLFGSY